MRIDALAVLREVAPADLAVMDCSFISLRKIIPPAIASGLGELDKSGIAELTFNGRLTQQTGP